MTLNQEEKNMDKQTSRELHKNIRMQNAEVISDGNTAKIYDKSKAVSKKRAGNHRK
jgi:hypothetical protein